MVQVFARVTDGVLISYPLTQQQINDLDTPTDDYPPVIYHDQPDYNPVIQNLIEKPTLYPDYLQVMYEVTNKTLDNLFAEVFEIAGSLGENNAIIIDVTKIPAELFGGIVSLVKINTQQRLDAFAATKGYDSIASVCTYYNSTDPTYKADAEIAIAKRDLTWSTLNSYLAGVETGTAPAPTSWAGIVALLPPLLWS